MQLTDQEMHYFKKRKETGSLFTNEKGSCNHSYCGNVINVTFFWVSEALGMQHVKRLLRIILSFVVCLSVSCSVCSDFLYDVCKISHSKKYSAM